MPDRAVVDCAWCSGDGYVTGSMPCPECTPTPRALVALSEDRQWLVVLHPDAERWLIHDLCHWGYQHYKWIPDTGQGADEVLAAWEGRHDGR